MAAPLLLSVFFFFSFVCLSPSALAFYLPGVAPLDFSKVPLLSPSCLVSFPFCWIALPVLIPSQPRASSRFSPSFDLFASSDLCFLLFAAFT
jgi:hypothetical protein